MTKAHTNRDAAMRELRVEMERSVKDLARLERMTQRPDPGRAAMTPAERREIQQGWRIGVPKRTGPEPKLPDELLQTFVRITDTEGHTAIVPISQKEKHMAKFNLPTATTKPAPAVAPPKAKAPKGPAAKAAPAPKAAPVKAAKAVPVAAKKAATGRSAFAGFPLDAKITVLSKEHDFVEGSIRHKAFEGILKAKTVEQARTANSDPWHLRTAVAKRRVKVG